MRSGSRKCPLDAYAVSEIVALYGISSPAHERFHNDPRKSLALIVDVRNKTIVVDALMSRSSCILDSHFCNNPMGVNRLAFLLLGITAMHNQHSRFISSTAIVHNT